MSIVGEIFYGIVGVALLIALASLIMESLAIHTRRLSHVSDSIGFRLVGDAPDLSDRLTGFNLWQRMQFPRLENVMERSVGQVRFFIADIAYLVSVGTQEAVHYRTVHATVAVMTCDLLSMPLVTVEAQASTGEPGPDSGTATAVSFEDDVPFSDTCVVRARSGDEARRLLTRPVRRWLANECGSSALSLETMGDTLIILDKKAETAEDFQTAWTRLRRLHEILFAEDSSDTGGLLPRHLKRMVRVTRKLANVVRNEHVFLRPIIPPGKLRHARLSYASDCSPEETPLVLVENRDTDGFEGGLLITDRMLYAAGAPHQHRAYSLASLKTIRHKSPPPLPAILLDGRERVELPLPGSVVRGLAKMLRKLCDAARGYRTDG